MRLAASTVQSRLFFESTLPEELFELKNEETIKKIREPTRHMYLLGPIHHHKCMARSNLVRQFL
jgi:hypothetical protein